LVWNSGVHVEGTVKTQRGSDGGHDLAEVGGVGRLLFSYAVRELGLNSFVTLPPIQKGPLLNIYKFPGPTSNRNPGACR
jgi:hypothetical protein